MVGLGPRFAVAPPEDRAAAAGTSLKQAVPPARCQLSHGAGDESGWSSRLAVRTGRLKRSPAVHARPIDLVVFQEPSQPSLPETSSRRGLRA